MTGYKITSGPMRTDVGLGIRLKWYIGGLASARPWVRVPAPIETKRKTKQTNKNPDVTDAVIKILTAKKKPGPSELTGDFY